MPELPEIEVVVRSLRERILGQTVERVEVGWCGCIDCPDADGFSRQLSGRTVAALWRRGKYILFEMVRDFAEAGSPRRYLILHFRMTGKLLFASAQETRAALGDKHCHLAIVFQSGDALYYSDMRKFGRLYLVERPEDVLGDLGPEPLAEEMTPARLAELLHGHRRQLKPLLLDQRVLAGLGNIYVDEALWAARVHPLRRSDSLSRTEVDRLHASIRSVLLGAIENGGTTLRNYRDAQGRAGRHQRSLAVYGRQGEPCLRCGQEIEKRVIGGRGTHYCAVCQPLDGSDRG